LIIGDNTGGREFESQKPAKSNSALQSVRHRFIYVVSCVFLALCRGKGHRKLVTRCDVIRRE